LKHISDRLYQVSTGWVTLAALVIFMAFTALVLPSQAASADELGEGTPDLSLYYSPADLYRFAESYGEQGRRAYVRARFTFDLIWPLVYTFFLATATSWLFARAFRPENPWRLANLVPLAAMLFDFLENLSTSLIMLRYPARTPVIDALAPLFTLVKWLLVGGSFVILLVGPLIAGWGAIKKRFRD
jgi:hypothetical protein